MSNELEKLSFAELQEKVYRVNQANSHDGQKNKPLTPDEIRINNSILNRLNQEINRRRDARATEFKK